MRDSFYCKTPNFANFSNLVQISGPTMIRKSQVFFIDLSFLFTVICDAPEYCCQNGDQGCEGQCIPESWLDDGEKDCENGSDEKGRCKF